MRPLYTAALSVFVVVQIGCAHLGALPKEPGTAARVTNVWAKAKTRMILIGLFLAQDNRPIDPEDVVRWIAPVDHADFGDFEGQGFPVAAKLVEKVQAGFLSAGLGDA